MGKFARRQDNESHVGPARIVVPPPGLDNHFCFLQCFKTVQVQALIAKQSIEAFHMAVIGWLFRATEIDPCLMMVSP